MLSYKISMENKIFWVIDYFIPSTQLCDYNFVFNKFFLNAQIQWSYGETNVHIQSTFSNCYVLPVYKTISKSLVFYIFLSFPVSKHNQMYVLVQSFKKLIIWF